MRIQRFDLLAYGPFSDLSLDLSQGRQGLHLIYGDNEAGKSTSLRALTGWLFGIPKNTGDAHLHDMGSLRVGGVLRRDDGEELEAIRRKGRVNTLIRPGDESAAVDEDLLARFLGGVDEKLFRFLYGIDHRALEQGARDILEQKGEIGTTLYAAALGTARLKQVLARLDEQAGYLFRPRGSKPAVNEMIGAYNQARKEAKAARLAGSVWDKVRRELVRAERELREADEELRRKRRERNRLDRIQRVLRPIGLRRELACRLEDLGDMPDLPAEMREELRRARDELRATEENVRTVGVKLERVRRDLERIVVPAGLLEQRARIKDLYQEAGAAKKTRRDLPAQQGKSRALRAEIRAAIEAFRPGRSPDDIKELKPVASRRRRFEKLIERHHELAERQREVRRAVLRQREETKDIEAQLAGTPEPADLSDLSNALDAARDAGDLDGRIASLAAEETAGRRECEQALGRLSLWDGDLGELEAASLPLPETLEHHDGIFRSLAEARRDLEGKLQEQEERRAGARKKIEVLRRGGDVPDANALDAARTSRDDGWRLVRRSWLEGEDIAELAAEYASDRGLADAFERKVQDADEVADRLRLDADRVQQQQALRAEIEEVGGRIEKLGRERKSLEQEYEAARERWRAVWAPSGVEPLSPREMRAWLGRAEDLRKSGRDLANLEAELAKLGALRDRHIAALGGAIGDLGVEVPSGDGSLDPLRRKAAEVIKAGAKDAERRHGLQRALEQAGERLAQAEKRERQAADERADWSREWEKAVALLGMEADADPADVSQALDQLREIQQRIDELDKHEKRIWGMEKHIKELDEAVLETAERIGFERGELEAGDVIGRLHDALESAGKAQTRRKEIEARAAEFEDEIAIGEQRIEDLRARIETMRDRAGVATDEELEVALDRADQRREAAVKLDEANLQIQDAGAGVGLDELERQVDEIDPDGLPGRIAGAEEEIEELERRRSELADARAERKQAFEAMGGSQTAAEAAERAEQALAGAREAARRYLRLRAAGLILRDRIEKFRSENQAPMLRRASELFQVLTLGSFEALRDDLDEKDTPILLGIRPGSRTLRVDEMSDGVRDQLYLALRLAALEKHMESAEPLPFVVDDILIGFDDSRTRAALDVLAELARRTQVLLFTHHRRVVEIADRLEADAGVFVHELGVSSTRKPLPAGDGLVRGTET